MSSLKKIRNLLNSLYYNEMQSGAKTHLKEFAPQYLYPTFTLFIKLVDKHLSNLQKEIQKPNPRPWELLEDKEAFKLAKGLKNARRNIWEYLEGEGEGENNETTR